VHEYAFGLTSTTMAELFCYLSVLNSWDICGRCFLNRLEQWITSRGHGKKMTCFKPSNLCLSYLLLALCLLSMMSIIYHVIQDGGKSQRTKLRMDFLRNAFD